MALSILKRAAPNTSRERLKAALAARVDAQRDVEAAEAVVERVRRVIQEERPAADLAAQAEATAKALHRAWGHNGCDPATAGEHERAAADAVEARRVADRAKIAAQAARQGSGRAEEALESARLHLSWTGAPIADARGMILVEQPKAATALARLLAAAEEYRAAEIDVAGLKHVVAPQHCESSDHASRETARLVEDVIDRAKIRKLTEYESNNSGSIIREPCAEVLAAREAYREIADRLRENPDAN